MAKNQSGTDFRLTERQLQVVEMQAGQASARSYQQMQKGAQSEMLCLVRPPFYSSSPTQVDELRVAATKRGVRYRSIYDPQVLELPGWLSEIRRCIDSGEEVRVLPNLPGKFASALRHIKGDEHIGGHLVLGHHARDRPRIAGGEVRSRHLIPGIRRVGLDNHRNPMSAAHRPRGEP